MLQFSYKDGCGVHLGCLCIETLAIDKYLQVSGNIMSIIPLKPKNKVHLYSFKFNAIL